MNFRKLTIAAAMLLGISSLSLQAQNYKLPSAHSAEHSDLIAGQANVGNQIKVENTQKFLDMLFSEEFEPEDGDIYELRWGSQFVNCYTGLPVPQRKTIDVSKFAMPCSGYMTSPYGYRPRFGRMHRGVDLAAVTGDTIYAAFEGKIRIVSYEAKGYGNYIVMRHPNELETVYGHLSKVLVKPNQIVKVGQPIGLAGNTGRSFGSHLHFETRFMGYAINPAAIFDFYYKTVHTDTYTFDKNTYTEGRGYGPYRSQESRRQLSGVQEPAKNYNVPRSNSVKAAASKAATKSAKQTGSKNVTVKSGDSLSKVAAKNGITVNQLCKLNGIKSSATIKPGQKLRVK